jgi:cyclic nucleotide-binding protein
VTSHHNDIEPKLAALKARLESYAPISEATWQRLRALCTTRTLAKGETLYATGERPTSFAFVYRGLFRVYALDTDGREYNKNFFDEGMFPGSMAALLTETPSQFAFEALEASEVLLIDFAAYRQLLFQSQDLMVFQIAYLEKNWLLAKDAREVEIIQENATQRYQRFLTDFADMSERIPQYHIASHLGITPTQLSRIRKKLN